MLSKKDITEVIAHLEKAQNPVFLYDNDCDGLCSFLILRRFLGRGLGVAIKSYPALDVKYALKVQQLKADYVFVLDKPVISDDFLKEIDLMQLPLVWIDHHETSYGAKRAFKKYSNFSLYNAVKKREQYGEPVSYLCYKITNRKEDIWLSLIGCIADAYLPDFSDEFGKNYPNFWKSGIKKPFDAYYGTEIGRIAESFNFGLKDSISHVVEMQNFLVNCKGPEEVFLEMETNSSFRQKYGEIRKKYDLLLEEAKKNIDGKMIFFDYGGDLSISADLSNELRYKNQDKFVVVCYKKGPITNISMRGDNVRAVLQRVLKKMENATGGGHEKAVGARVRTEDLGKFRELFEKEIK